jgi:hypothetical protein
MAGASGGQDSACPGTGCAGANVNDRNQTTQLVAIRRDADPVALATLPAWVAA